MTARTPRTARAPRRSWGRRWLDALEQRLASNDTLQVTVAYTLVLAFVLLTRWPAGTAVDNAVWYPLVQTRAALGALLGLAYGSAEASAVPRRRGATLGALLLLPVVTMPFEAAAHGASFPAVPFAWSIGSALSTIAAFYALGLGLGAASRRLRLQALLPLLVPGALALAVVADLRLERIVFNPMVGATTVAPLHGAVLAAGSVAALAVTLGASLRVERRAREAREGDGS